MSNSFIENVNYLAGLDNNYGDGIILSKNNLSLRNVANDVTLKFSYFNYNTKQIETVTKLINGMLYTGLETALQEFCAQIESTIGENKFNASYSISSSNTGFLIHSFSININSLDEKLKCTELNFKTKITSTQVYIYNIYGEVINPLKLLAVIAMLEPEFVDAIPIVYENIDSIISFNSNTGLLNDIANEIIPNINEILEADNNAIIASQKASEASASASSALEFKNSASNSATIATANANESELNASSALSSSNISTTKANEASASASSALSSKNAAAISETNSANSALSAVNSAELALEYKNSAFTSSTSAENSAAIAVNNANASLINANSASSSATNASLSESNALNSANIATEKANSILNLDVEMTELPHGSNPTTDYNPGSGVFTIGIPEVIDGVDGASVTSITSSKVGNVTTVNQYIDGVLSNTFEVSDGIDGEQNVNADWNSTSGDSEILNKPTTVSGYGITDAYTKTEVQTALPKVGFDTTNVITPSTGQFAWNIDESTLDLGLNGAVLQVGQEQLIRVRNNSGANITNGTAVMATGTIGNSGRITIAKANLTQANAKYILGVVTEDIVEGADGFCTVFGKIRAIQTNGTNYGETWVDGDVLYVKDSGNGALTKVIPTDTQVKLPIAIVIHSHGTNGSLFVRVNSIDENHAKADIALKADITYVDDLIGDINLALDAINGEVL